MYSWSYCMVYFQDTLSSVLPEWPSKEFLLFFPSYSFFTFIANSKFFVCMEEWKEIPRAVGKDGVWGLFLWDFFLSFTSLSALELTLLKSLASFLCHCLLYYFFATKLAYKEISVLFHIPVFSLSLYFHFYRSPWVMILVCNSNNLPYPTFNYPQGLEPVSKT